MLILMYKQGQNTGLLLEDGSPLLTFSGSATGQRYQAESNATIETWQSVTYLPGNIGGTTTAGGFYG